jgi:hypothetical protein
VKIRIKETNRLNKWAERSLNIQDDSEIYFIYNNGVKYGMKTRKELLERLAEQTDETILLLIKQNPCKQQF